MYIDRNNILYIGPLKQKKKTKTTRPHTAMTNRARPIHTRSEEPRLDAQDSGDEFVTLALLVLPEPTELAFHRCDWASVSRDAEIYAACDPGGEARKHTHTE